MNLLNEAVGTLFACVWFAVLALPFAAIPPLLLFSALRTMGHRWIVTQPKQGRITPVPYVRLGILGGLAGETAAVCSLFFATEWNCMRGNSACYDGQAGMVLMFTVPLLSALGSGTAILWTRIALGIPADRVFASFLCYSGPRRVMNQFISLAIVIACWGLAVLAGGLLSL